MNIHAIKYNKKAFYTEIVKGLAIILSPLANLCKALHLQPCVTYLA